MGSYQFKQQMMNREETCSWRLGHPFPSRSWIKSYLKTVSMTMNPQHGEGIKWEGLILILNLFMILKEDWR